MFGKFEKVDVSTVPFEAVSEIYTTVTYDHEKHFDVNTKKYWIIGLTGIEF